MTSTEIERIDPTSERAALTLFGTTDPAEAVRQTVKYADALTEIVQRRELYTNIQGKKFVEVTGWQVLGSMLGVFAVGEGEPEYVEIDGKKGFKATVTAQMRDGSIVGRATAYCMDDEKTWKTRQLYAVAGMAQTRATGRALRAPLGFIVKLAGFESQLPDEMPKTRLPIDQDDGPDDTLEGEVVE